GSIKGDVKRKTSPLPHGDGEGRCLTSSPCAALLWSVVLRGIPVHQLLRSSCRAGAPASSVAAVCQPWFYRRLLAYVFVVLSEGHTVARETGCLTRPGYSPSNPCAPPPEEATPA